MKRGQYRKSDHTPEEWAAYLEKVRAYRHSDPERTSERLRAYNAKPHVKAARKYRDSHPSAIARRREYANDPNNIARAKDIHIIRSATDPMYLKGKFVLQRYRRTGFTPQMIDELLSFQGNKCAICAREFRQGEKICADHCHDTGESRGLLCHFCNTAEGMIKHTGLSPDEFVQRLKSYLAETPLKRFNSSIST